MLPHVSDLRTGDVLLYSGTGPFSTFIKVKTWSKYSHCEVYDGNGFSVASRDGKGVARYPVRTDYVLVLRLLSWVPFDLAAARDWFTTVDGQGYDWWGLAAFTLARFQGNENDKQFCSEFAARYIRAGIGAAAGHPVKVYDRRELAALALDPWRGRDSDAIAPEGFNTSALFGEVETPS